jgi:hypothetical protein
MKRGSRSFNTVAARFSDTDQERADQVTLKIQIRPLGGLTAGSLSGGSLGAPSARLW